MEVAAESAKGKFEEFGHHAGTLGRMLEQFGPLGLGAAAGVGAMTLAFDRLVEGARESFEQLHRLETSAERLGVGTSALQELHFAFGHLGIDAGEADSVIEHLTEQARESGAVLDAAFVEKGGSSTFQVDWKKSPRGAAIR